MKNPNHIYTPKPAKEKYEHTLASYNDKKARIEDLESILDNHLNHQEIKLPLDPACMADFNTISQRYYGLLYNGQDGWISQPEYGMSIEALAKYLKVTQEEFNIDIRKKEIPEPISIYNGEKKYNLMQAACIIEGNTSWKEKGDQTKAWYTHLHHEMDRKLQKLNRKLEKVRSYMTGQPQEAA